MRFRVQAVTTPDSPRDSSAYRGRRIRNLVPWRGALPSSCYKFPFSTDSIYTCICKLRNEPRGI